MTPTEAIRLLTNAGIPSGAAYELATSLRTRGLLTDAMVHACIHAANSSTQGA